eukprot:365338-Chlamydomonas_euryale.AAC.9
MRLRWSLRRRHQRPRGCCWHPSVTQTRSCSSSPRCCTAPVWAACRRCGIVGAYRMFCHASMTTNRRCGALGGARSVAVPISLQVWGL